MQRRLSSLRLLAATPFGPAGSRADQHAQPSRPLFELERDRVRCAWRHRGCSRCLRKEKARLSTSVRDVPIGGAMHLPVSRRGASTITSKSQSLAYVTMLSATTAISGRSEERRVGKECEDRRTP